MFSSKILAQSYAIKHYIKIEKTFVVVAFDNLVLHKYQKDMTMIVLKQAIEIDKKGENFKFKSYTRK